MQQAMLLVTFQHPLLPTSSGRLKKLDFSYIKITRPPPLFKFFKEYKTLSNTSPYSQYFPALRGEIMKLEVFLRCLLLWNQCWSHKTCSKFNNFNFDWFLKYLFWFQNIDSRTIENRFFFQNINLKRRSSFSCVVYEQALGKDQFLLIFFQQK